MQEVAVATPGPLVHPVPPGARASQAAPAPPAPLACQEPQAVEATQVLPLERCMRGSVSLDQMSGTAFHFPDIHIAIGKARHPNVMFSVNANPRGGAAQWSAGLQGLSQ